MMKCYLFILFLIITGYSNSVSQDIIYLKVNPKSGDGAEKLLQRYELAPLQQYLTSFKELNPGVKDLNLSKQYILPIKIVPYNGKSIRLSLGISDYNLALKIQHYNEKMVSKGIKSKHIKIDKQVWVPIHMLELENQINQQSKNSVIPPVVNKNSQQSEINSINSIFGKKYSQILKSSNDLSGCVFYICSGHGGPDPGAIGTNNGMELHEDEYAYDVSLRFAKKLMENGAEVYIIVIDSTDGIRDDRFLNFSYNEYYFGGSIIPKDQRERLRKRVEIINNLYHKNTGKKQYVIETHVDSRYSDRRIDIFFYYQNQNNESKDVCQTLLETIENKYENHQPGRGYEGTVSSRSLYMLNNCLPTTVYIEIGNIKNPADQVRLIEVNNRQAIANWLSLGFINYLKKK